MPHMIVPHLPHRVRDREPTQAGGGGNRHRNQNDHLEKAHDSPPRSIERRPTSGAKGRRSFQQPSAPRPRRRRMLDDLNRFGDRG
jgi:hypothetical protein